MKLLAVETSTPAGAVALLDEDRVVGECRLAPARTHGERLLPTIDGLLAACGWQLDELDGFAVAVGPGSFTGLRIGVSTVKALAFATGKPLVGVPTLDALAWTVPFAAWPVCPVLDARKGEVYAAAYRTTHGQPERLTEYRAVRPEAWTGELRARGLVPAIFLGDGVAVYGRVLERELGDDARLAPPSHRLPSAAAVGELGRRALARGQAVAPAALVPLYVRRPEAELAAGRGMDGSGH